MHRKHLFKLLNLSVLAIVGVMALSASTAQAKWLIRENGASVGSINLVGGVEVSSELLVSGGLGVNVHCSSVIAEAKIETVESGKVIQGSGVAKLSGCEVVKNKNCIVTSPGQAAGTIVASGSGTGAMEGAKTFTKLSSSEFTFVEFSGPLCPLTELSAEVNGTGIMTILNAATEEKVHTVEIDDEALFYGQEKVLLHKGGTEVAAVQAKAQAASGNSWSIQLVGL